MKHLRNSFLSLLLFAGLGANARQLPTSLVPATPSRAADYFCTWNIQGFDVSYEGDTRNMMTEQQIFGQGRWQNWINFFPRIRQDVYFLLDDSWDMPLDYSSVIQQYYGLIALDAERFPSHTETDPVQRLRSLARRVEGYGWKGLAGWVCAQESPLDSLHQDVAAYWRHQFERAHQAGVHYLKVDYGRHERDPQWRQLLSDVAHEVSPELIIEHASPKGPTVTDTGLLDADIASRSDVFRTYDVETFISIPVSLRRVMQVLEHKALDGYKGIVNCEDEPYMAAGLGCLIGIMRHPYAGALPNGKADHVFPLTSRDVKHRLDEVVRAVRWHRLAEPFGMNADLQVDTALLTDRWLLGPRETWFDGHKEGMEITESAPARVSRCMPLPRVEADGLAPYVLASRYPNGAVAVAALERLDGRVWSYPQARVGFETDRMDAPIGLFGYYQEVTIQFPEKIQQRGLHILAQDLASDTAVDITRQVRIRGNRLIVPGSVISRVGLSAATPGDVSAPGLVLQLCRE